MASSMKKTAHTGSSSKTWGANEDLSAAPPKSRAKQREPPPVLFLHPSPGASHVSLPGALAPGAQIPGPASTRRDQPTLERSVSVRSGPGAPSEVQQRPGRALLTAASTRSADRTDALWAEMQATLEEVELSASGGTHVFGPEHDHKLTELRTAQIALAQAWARSEADDAIETTLDGDLAPSAGDDLRNIMVNLAEAPWAGADETDAAKSTVGTTSGRPESSSGGADLLGAKLEEETEVDILMARKRREANDRYFQRVNQGVIDVVAKLEDVAVAMRAVEQESKDVWHGGGSHS
ncbi:hypothetical protein JDV02_005908 [Purpureocillium takamizusanense]|uniref:Uncharacterized protein n=1 Tax=Purpureocillium takamizusanense TaxID=2060973 RepID=A0A9Q8QJJ5_9HYPO|nr:uncharacterized protein JDV02_005908 [Purpureocillium takamizusanense]UNI19747.1 hypothetical protein JDV02_005908 [Purpureocillium takamizusanense]